MQGLIKAENVVQKLTLLQQVLHELANMERDIDSLQHGEITLIVQDNRLIRVTMTKSRKVA